MRNTRKILVALVLVLTLLVGMTTIFASAAKIPGGTKLYLVPSANWNQSNARFAAYFFGDGEAWVSMTKVAGESNLYEVTSPAGKNFTNVIFCRMNPGASANNWNNKWNQTSDLVFNGSANCYTVKEGTWDKGGGTWSTYGNACAHSNLGPAATCTAAQECLDCGDPVVSALGHTFNSAHLCTRCNEQASFTVAGTGAHLGTEWDTGNTANDMTYADGVYTKVYENVAAGSYQFKVARDHDWGTAYPDADKSFTVSTAGSTVTITLQGTTVNVTVDLPHVHNFVEGKCECGEEDPNYVPPHEHNFVEGKCECGEEDPNYVPHVNALLVGDTNKIVVTGNTLNDYGLPIEWVAFVADEKAHYEFVGPDGALAFIFDANYTLISGTGAADLEAGTYLICLGNGAVGEFNVAVTKTAIEEPVLPEYNWWVSDGSLYTVEGDNIKYNGAGNTYACVGCDVTTLAAGNNTFTITITNNGAAKAKVRVDLQATVQVGNHKVVNVSAVGGDVWTDSDWGGSHVHVAPGESVTLVITYDETTDRGAVKDLIIFADSARGDGETYSADITVSGMEFSNVVAEPDYTNTLVVGDNNVIIGKNAIDNGYGYLMESVIFTAEEAAHYEFAGAGLTILVYDLEMHNLCAFTGKADLEAGMYIICFAANTVGTKGEYTISVSKSEISEEPPVEIELPKLQLGDNTVVIDGTVTNPGGQAIAWLEFVVTEAGNYKVSSSALNCYICADMSFANVLCNWTGAAYLESGTYYVAVGNSGITGEFTVKAEVVGELPAVNTIVVGENKYVLNAPLQALGFEWMYLTVEKDGTYAFSGLSPLTFFIWPDYPNQATVDANAAYVWNVDNVTYDLLDGFTVDLVAGTYLIGVRFDGDAETVAVGEYNYSITAVESQPEQPEQPEVELNLFQKIMKAITDFFAQISVWFENLLAGLKK